jgi:hypothetical protein
MFELEELRKKIEDYDYEGALKIIDELEEMSKEDKLNKIYSYCVILLLHLIKQNAEARTTSSWERSIFNSVDNINRINKRRKSGGYYASREDLLEIIKEAYPRAIREASYEAFEGKLSTLELEQKCDFVLIQNQAINFLDAEKTNFQ